MILLFEANIIIILCKLLLTYPVILTMRYHYKVLGIDCPMCALALSRMLRQIKDFQSVNLNIMTHDLIIYTWLDQNELDIVLGNNAFSAHGQLTYKFMDAA